ncbi:CBS domain-containing protein [Bacillus sp. 1P06AnD]|uniref:CBS domain-containing protein n=1 Tax=Bacillus sp. 1P06AnD TaxID=3132208 RepID=UPI0039A01132
MFVKSIMKPRHDCYTVKSTDSLQTAMDVLSKNGVDAVPVLNGNKYAGILTQYTIYEGYFKNGGSRDEFLQQKTAGELAGYSDEFLRGDEIFEHTVIKMKKFPLLPVLDGKGEFYGIVTRYDVLDQFQSAFGMQKKGIRIAFTSVETEGRLAKFTDIAHQYHEHIISLVTFDEGDPLVRRIVMKIEPTANLEKFTKKLEESGFRILSITEEV